MFTNKIKGFGQFESTPTLGVPCHFVYDAKFKDELPYWDKFPLCIPADNAKNGFLGWNLHYVTQRTRKIILDELFKYAEFTPRAKLEASYKFLKSISIFDDIKPCIKHYLISHVKSKFLNIDPHNWYKVIKLPTAKWQNSTPYPNAK
jgi:hypothetical protein